MACHGHTARRFQSQNINQIPHLQPKAQCLVLCEVPSLAATHPVTCDPGALASPKC